MITCVGCNTFSLLNVVAYSLQKPLIIIIGCKKIIFGVGLLIGWRKVFLLFWLVSLVFFLADHQ